MNRPIPRVKYTIPQNRYGNRAVTITHVKAKRRIADPFDALGNPYRREIVELLARKPRSGQQILDHLPISRPVVSRHLSVLNRAGLVSYGPVAARRLYRLAQHSAQLDDRYRARL